MANSIGDMVVKIVGDNSEFDNAIDNSAKKAKSMTQIVAESTANLAKSFKQLDGEAKVWGNSVDILKQKQEVLKKEISELISKGLDPTGKEIQKLKNQYNSLGEQITKLETKQVSLNDKMAAFATNMSKIGNKLSLFVTAPIIALGGTIVKSTASMEMLEASFTTMLGGADKAKKMLKDLTDFAARTPFEMQGLAQGTKTLLQFGISAEKIMPTIQMLGDIAQGNQQRFDSLALVYGQVQSAGRLMGQDLLQLINVGFNPLQVISEKTGKSMAELKKDMEKGAISANDVTDAFIAATSAGGKFFGGMELASKTFSGKLSTLKDDLSALGREFGEVLLPLLKDIIGQVSEWVKSFSGLSDESKKFVLVLVGMAAAAGPAAKAIGGLTKAIQYMASKPIVAIISGVAALGVGLAILRQRAYEADVDRLAEEFKDVASVAGIAADEVIAIGDALRIGSLGGFQTAAEQVDELAESLNLSKMTVIEIGLKNKSITEEYRNQLQALKDQLIEETTILKTRQFSGNAIRDAMAQQLIAEARLKEQERQRAEEEKKAAEEEKKRREEAQKLSATAIQNIEHEMAVITEKGILAKKYGDEYNEAEERRKAILKEINTLLENNFTINGASIQNIINKYGKWLSAADKVTTATTKQYKSIKQIEEAQENAANKAAQIALRYPIIIKKSTDTVIEQVQKYGQVYSDTENSRRAVSYETTKLIEQNEIDSIKRIKEARVQLAWAYVSSSYQLATSIAGIYSAITDAKINSLDKELSKVQESYEKQLAALEEANGLGTLSDEDYYAQKAALLAEQEAAEERYEKRKIELEREEAKRQKAISVFNIIISTAQAIAKSLPNMILAAIAAAAGAAQLAIVAATPLPELAEGGIVPATSGGRAVKVAEAGQPEIIFPLDRLEDFLSDRSMVSSNRNNEMIHLVVKMDSKPFLDKIFPATRNRQVLISAEAVV